MPHALRLSDGLLLVESQTDCDDRKVNAKICDSLSPRDSCTVCVQIYL